MKITQLVEALGQTVAALPKGASKERAVAAIVRNGDLNYVTVFTDGVDPSSGSEGIAMNVVAFPLQTLDYDSLPDYVVTAVNNAAAEYRGQRSEGLVP